MEPEPSIGLHNLKPADGSRKDRKRIGRGHGSGHGKTSGRGHKGYGSRSGAKQRTRFEGGQNPLHMRMRKLRGPNKKMSMPFEPFRTHTQHVNLDDLARRFDDGAADRPGRAQAHRPGDQARRAGQDPRPRRARQEAHRPRPQVLQDGPRADRVRRRDLPAHRVLDRRRTMVSTILNAFRVAEIRKKLAFTAALLALYRLGSFIPVPGVNLDAIEQLAEQLLDGQHPRLPQPVHGRRAVADRDLRARDHAVHHGLDHPAAADGRLAVAGEAAEGGRGRAGAHHAVHALPDRRRSPPPRRSATSSCSARRATPPARR